MVRLTDYLSPLALRRLNRLELVARTVVEGFISGLHKSPYKGLSVEFAEHRQYVKGDEIRHIDWKVWGKSDRYYIKRYEEETNLKAYLLLDASGSMNYHSEGRPAKFEVASQVVAALSFLCLRQSDSVGLVTFDTAVREYLPPQGRATQMRHILEIVSSAKPGGETNLSAIFHNLAERIRRRGLIVVVSDCLDRVQDLLQALNHFRFRKHEVLVFHVLDPAERTFPFKKWVLFRGLEKPDHKVLVDTLALREQYLRNFTAYLDELKEGCFKRRIDYCPLSTEAPIEEALSRYLSHRMR